tara:strand:+ start:6083 stop:6925 length:843 start_codon:yes stop_codon:yes gene_type:complete
MKVKGHDLIRLLNATKRESCVNGRQQAQVMACVLRKDEKGISTTAIVRDGLTSVGHFRVETAGDGGYTSIPLPDIERVIGVLKAHDLNSLITITVKGDDGKILFKSPNKQTTLKANFEGLAFPHSKKTIREWEEESLSRAGQIGTRGYLMKDGILRPWFVTFTVGRRDLLEALSCDNINGQRLNRYAFVWDDDDESLIVKVGDSLKGMTETWLEHTSEWDMDSNVEDFEATFEGGLEYVLKNMDAEHIDLCFADFREEGQGIRLCLRDDDGSWVFQAGVL